MFCALHVSTGQHATRGVPCVGMQPPHQLLVCMPRQAYPTPGWRVGVLFTCPGYWLRAVLRGYLGCGQVESMPPSHQAFSHTSTPSSIFSCGVSLSVEMLHVSAYDRVLPQGMRTP